MKNPKQPNASRCQSKQSKGSKKQASNMSGLPRNGRIWKETAARDGDLCHKRLEEYLQNNSVNCTINGNTQSTARCCVSGASGSNET